MAELNEQLRRLGRQIASESDARSNDEMRARVRRRLLSGAEAQPRRRGWPRRATLVAVAAAALLALVFVGHSLRDQPLHFSVGSPPQTGEVGSWLAAESDNLAMAFSDGTRLSLAPGGRMRITEVTKRGATVLVEAGRLRADVGDGGADREWLFRSGPFTIHVTGTAFDVAWDPKSESFELDMDHGSVVVNGPVLGERTVVGGERLRVAVADSRVTILQGDEPTAQRGLPDDDHASGRQTPAADETEATQRATAVPEPAASSSAKPRTHARWSELAAAGKHREAMESLDDGAFASVIGGASSADLRLLADVARFGGRPARAREALLALRQRHGARGETAFLLGKIAADQLGSPGDAASWFETYLSEAPSGALAEQALGRLLELNRANPPRAQALAKRYLERYPGGGYAPLARQLAGP